jgi:hypothetical protein
VSTSKSHPRKVQFIVSHELDFGACAPLTKEFPPLFSLPFEKSLAITSEVLDLVIGVAAQESGVVVKAKVYGLGGYERRVNASAQTRISGTRKAMQLFINVLGYLSQQTEIYTFRPREDGNKAFVQIVEMQGKTKLAGHQATMELFNRLTVASPNAKGFSPFVDDDGNHGIRIFLPDSECSDDEIQAIVDNLKKIGEDMGLDFYVDSGRLEFGAAANDWSKHGEGESYLQRAVEIGRTGVQGRLVGAHRTAVRQLLEGTFRKHAPEELRQFREGRSRPAGGCAPLEEASLDQETSVSG